MIEDRLFLIPSNRIGVKGLIFLSSFLYIALPDARETCCSSIILINVVNPGRLAQRGGTPSAL